MAVTLCGTARFGMLVPVFSAEGGSSSWDQCSVLRAGYAVPGLRATSTTRSPTPTSSRSYPTSLPVPPYQSSYCPGGICLRVFVLNRR
eukprot:3446460-Rhodomonas_salina.2